MTESGFYYYQYIEDGEHRVPECNLSRPELDRAYEKLVDGQFIMEQDIWYNLYFSLNPERAGFSSHPRYPKKEEQLRDVTKGLAVHGVQSELHPFGSIKYIPATRLPVPEHTHAFSQRPRGRRA